MSSEVGSGHVSIFPVMTGFKSRVTKETKDAGAAGARNFEGGFKGAGVKAGRTLGRDLKSALTSSAGNLASESVGRLNQSVAAASAALSRARLQQADQAGRVRIEEARLAEALATNGQFSAKAIAAEERLEAARRRHSSATDAVSTATTRLKAAQDSLRSTTDAAAASASRGASGFGAFGRGLRAGFADARVASRDMTGIAGSIGGVLRAVSDVTGLTTFGRLLRLSAQQASQSFTSLATMVGGRLAGAWSVAARGASTLGGLITRGLSPVAGLAARAGQAIASPFMRLGTRVSSYLSPVTTQVTALFSKVSAVGGPAAARLVSSFRSGLSGLGSAASSGFQAVVSAASRAGAAAGRALGNGVQGAATGAVGIAAAGVGIALTKGFSRLGAIDTARAKLKGLGNDATSVDSIMGDALASVRGTSFGLGEAATVAAGAVAAGITPGEKLQATLKGVANVAAATGSSLEDTGAIYNKVASTGRAYTENLNQLADRGLPIYQALANQLGVTTDEVRELASKGEISFETFSTAAAAAAGTVAKEMGQTVPGAAKNFFSAMGRIGANALEPIYGRIAPLIIAATSALGPIEERAKVFGGILLNVLGPALDWLTTLFTNIGNGAGLVGSGLENLAGIAGPLTGIIAALGAGGFAGLLAKLGPLGALLPGLGGLLGALASPLGIATAALAGFFLSGGDAGALSASITGIISSITAALPGLVTSVAAAIPQLVSAILAQVPALLTAGVEIVQALVQGLVVAIPALATGAVSLVTGLVSALVAALPAIIAGAITLVQALITGLVTAIPLLLTAGLQLVTGLLTAIIGALPVIIQGGLQLLLALVMGILAALPTLLTAVVGLVVSLLDTLISNLPMIIEGGVQLLLSLVNGLVSALPQLLTAIISLILQLVVAIITLLPKLIEAGVELIVALVVGLVKAIPEIIKMLPKIVTAIWDGLAGVDWAGLGMEIINGIIAGISAIGDTLVQALVDVAGAAFEGFKDFFGIASPAKKMIQPGRDIARGAQVGVEREQRNFEDSMRDLAQAGASRFESSINAVSPTVAMAVSARTGVNPDSVSVGTDTGAGRPIYADGIGLMGWLRELANGEAWIVWNLGDEKQERVQSAGSRRRY